MTIYQSRIKEIVGEVLSEVAFVQDYVELHFDDKIFRAIVHPVVFENGREIAFGPGWRDALCSLIGVVAISISFPSQGDEALSISFSNGSKVFVPLPPEAVPGPESVHYVPGENQPIEVW